MKPTTSSEHEEQDREIIKLLEELGTFKSTYPPELLTARRGAFQARVEQLETVEFGEELSAEDQEIVKLLGNLRSVHSEYPPQLLAARRSAFMRQLERAETTSLLEKFRVSIQRLFQSNRTTPTESSPGFMRISLVVASLVAAVFIGSLFFRGAEGSFQPSPSQAVAAPTHPLPTSTGEGAILICKPVDQTPSCPPGELDPSQNLADPGNGPAQPAVSKDMRSNPDGVLKAAYVNDGRDGTSWVSTSADSWIKIDLGTVRTINTVSLRKGSPGSSQEYNPGQFVIAVALSDVYADGNSRDDSIEYAQVFDSEQTGFRGAVSQAETIQTQFPPVKARFVKITFEKAGVAIEEVGVFLVQPPELAKQPTRTPPYDVPGVTLTSTNILLAMDTATSVPWLLSDTAVPVPTDTPTPLPINTLPPTATSTPILIILLPSDTQIPATVQPSPTSADMILVTGNAQTLTFTCDGNAFEIRGHANTITLFGSCSSITVIGNGNHVFWQFGSPIIMDKGQDNIILQLQ
jgi:F5/8 type C domain/Protein of unknown function (DUF3060)